MSAEPAQPYALRDREGTVYDVGVDFTVKLGELAHGRGVAVMEFTTRHGEEPPDHTHPTEDELFYVLDGEITFRSGGRSFDLGPGGFAFLPKGLEHGYSIDGPGDVRLLVITAPVPGEPGWNGFVGDLERGG